MQSVLVMFRSDGERRSFSITRDMTVVGRREDCDLRIPLGEISRKHARLVRDGETLRLEDLGSSNGTFLNGQRVQEAVLNPGDSIQIGPVVFVLQIDGYPADDDLHPVIAEMVEQTESEPAPAENSPLSPTAQSEYEDLGQLEPLPASDLESAEGFESLSMGEEEPADDELMPAVEHETPIAEAPAEEALPELEGLDELSPLDSAPPAHAAPAPVAEDEPLELDVLSFDELEPLHDDLTASEHMELDFAPPAPAPRSPDAGRVSPPAQPNGGHASSNGDEALDLDVLPELLDDDEIALLPDEPMDLDLKHLDSPH